MFLKRKKSKAPATDFSRFFVSSKAAEKKRLIKDVVKKANDDQKQLYQAI
jgi:hypothetical protein